MIFEIIGWLFGLLLIAAAIILFACMVFFIVGDGDTEAFIIMFPVVLLAIMGYAVIVGVSGDETESNTTPQVIEVEEPTVTIESNEIYILGGFVMDGDDWTCQAFRADDADNFMTRETLEQEDFLVVCTSGELMVIDDIDYFQSMTKEEYLERTVN